MQGRVVTFVISTCRYNGDRLNGTASVEIVDGTLTGRLFLVYLNPCDDEPYEPELSGDWRKIFPTLQEEADELLSFIGDAAIGVNDADREHLVISRELMHVGRPPIDRTRFFSVAGAQTQSAGQTLYPLIGLPAHHMPLLQQAETLAALYIKKSTVAD